jgi:hypothetical protein
VTVPVKTAPKTAMVTGGRAKVASTTASVPLTCTGSPGAECKAKLVLSVIETVSRGKVIAVAAAASRSRKKVVVVLASRTVTWATGKRLTVKLSLNATGKRLLAKHPPLTAKLAITVGEKTFLSIVVFKAHKTR